MERTRLADRKLPDYTRGEDIANMVTHIVGGAIGITALILALIKSVCAKDIYGVVCGIVYGLSMTALYAVSSVYHGLHPGMGKKVMQVIDHCTIYFMITGTYTPILLCSIRPEYPAVAWSLFAAELGLAVFACVFTAIDHRKYRVLSMICYILMGWCIMFALKQTVQTIGRTAFMWLLWGGIAYTLGAVLYGIGSKKRYFHTVFHIFVDIGSLLQAVCVLGYVL